MDNIQKVIVNGIVCLFTEDRKTPLVPNEKYPYKYSLRHGETDWTSPITIERFVFVNWLGDILSPVPLLEEGEDYREIKSWSVSE